MGHILNSNVKSLYMMRLSGIDTIHNLLSSNLPFSKFPPFFKLSPIYLVDDISKMYKYVSINKLYS